MSASPDRRVFVFGGFRLDAAERALTGPDGRPIQLTRRLSDALVFMAERPGRLLDKQTLMDAIWPDVVVEENSLSQAISALRRALGERAGEGRYIATVPGLGYRFVPAVEVIALEAAPTPRHEPSIAVLPFDDLSEDGNQSYFADGIAEEILNQLARIDGLRVIGKTSSFHFRQRNEPPHTIAEQLGASHLLVGAVRKAGKRLRITVQLIDAAGHAQLWSERFDRELEDVFAIQEDVAGAVAAALRLTLGVGQASTPPGGTANLDAYDAYLRARAMEHQSGSHATIRAAELYREALALDPNFALAWVGLAEACRGFLIFVPERAEQAWRDLDEATTRAVTLAPDLWASHIAASWRYVLCHDWVGVERALARARELMPSSPPAFYEGAFLASIGRAHAAVEHFQAACRDDPLSLLTSSLLQFQLHVVDREQAAEAEYQRSLDLPGNRDIAEHIALHRAWARAESPRGVRAGFRRYLEHQAVAMPVFHKVFEVFDQPDAALVLLRAATSEPLYQAPTRQWFLACWLAHYGDADAALAALWRSHVELKGAQLNWLWLPVLAAVRRKRGFKDLLRQVKLVDYWRATGNWGDFCRPVGKDDFECD